MTIEPQVRRARSSRGARALRPALLGLVACGLVSVAGSAAEACTSLIVTRGAARDSSVMITYTCDGEFHPHLERTPAADHALDDSITIHARGEVIGKVAQVPHTYAVLGLINEHQVAIGETTFGGREELEDPQGLLQYWDLMQLALERARTAREAIDVITRLVERYGYRGPGESFSIADPREAWWLELIGKGPGGKGAVWVALRVPDGMVACHANQARIDTLPPVDPDRCRYAPDVERFAIARGYYDPQSKQPFSFRQAYDPPTPRSRRWAATRVWSLLRRVAPSLALAPDYHRAVPGAPPYPLWVAPDSALSLADVFSLMRDHYEDTAYDMTRGLDAGPYGMPNRWRPLDWEVDSVAYAWERPISTQQTAFSIVTQSRARWPDPIGGVLWYGLDDTYTTCYVPLYNCITALPRSHTVGRLNAFSWDSAWWVFNFVANIANLKYAWMVRDIRAVQAELEGTFLALQPAVEQTARALYATDRELMVRYLTDYSVTHAERVVDRWRELGEGLLTKYNDGYVKDAEGRPQDRGYPEAWLQRLVRERPEAFRLPERGADVPAATLAD